MKTKKPLSAAIGLSRDGHGLRRSLHRWQTRTRKPVVFSLSVRSFRTFFENFHCAENGKDAVRFSRPGGPQRR